MYRDLIPAAGPHIDSPSCVADRSDRGFARPIGPSGPDSPELGPAGATPSWSRDPWPSSHGAGRNSSSVGRSYRAPANPVGLRFRRWFVTGGHLRGHGRAFWTTMSERLLSSLENPPIARGGKPAPPVDRWGWHPPVDWWGRPPTMAHAGLPTAPHQRLRRTQAGPLATRPMGSSSFHPMWVARMEGSWRSAGEEGGWQSARKNNCVLSLSRCKVSAYWYQESYRLHPVSRQDSVGCS